MRRVSWEDCGFNGCLWCMRSTATLARIGHSCDCKIQWLKHLAQPPAEVAAPQDDLVSGEGR